MKNNIFHSFRFEIIVYSLLSLFYTLVTEVIIIAGLYGAGLFAGIISISSSQRMAASSSVQNNFSDNRLAKNYIINNNLQEPGAVLETQMLNKGYVCLAIGAAVLIGIMLFICYFLLLTRKFSVYLGEILTGINAVASGDFTTRIEIKNDDEFALIAQRLNKMTDDIGLLMSNERKNEHMKNDLITSVAHDLRTPLTSIIGYLDLARYDKNLSDQTRNKYISIAYDKSKRLEKLIEDLFNYTKFSSGEVNLSVSEIDIVKLMEQMAEEFYPSFQDNGLEYDFHTSEASIIVKADGDLMARAFANLISNAVKYGRDGKSVKIRLVKNTDTVSVSIINYGEVIPAKDIESIFDRFFRVENSRSRETGGTGLGLAIAKSIILMHGGSIRASSDLDGTVFEIVLDLHPDYMTEQVSEVEM